MTVKEKTIDLSLLKRLVSELEAAVRSAEDFRALAEEDKTSYIIEMSKAAGLCAGVMQESGLLIGDLQHATISAQNGAVPSKAFDLEKILGPLKGGGTN